MGQPPRKDAIPNPTTKNEKIRFMTFPTSAGYSQMGSAMDYSLAMRVPRSQLWDFLRIAGIRAPL